MKWMLLLVCLVLIAPVSAVTNWSYSTAGTYTWTCPANVTEVTVLATGAGGSGAGAFNISGSIKGGHGGEAGEHELISSLAVSPGVDYTIVVGANATRAAWNTSGGNGGNSSAFGNIYDGGLGGVSYINSWNGEDGDAGFYNTTRFAQNGTSSVGTGGAGGLGHGAGGGGAGAMFALPGTTTGGSGAPGAVLIYEYGTYPGHIVDFSALPVKGGAGTLVTFTDETVRYNSTNIFYSWDFGDGQTSNVTGTVNHVYDYYGIYTVSLTVGNTGSTDANITEEKLNYITIAYEASEIDMRTNPEKVNFHVLEGWGSPVPDVSISIVGLSTSAEWDWLPALLGVPTDEYPINSTLMTQTTDTLGTTTFLMIPSVKYNVTFTKAGYTIPSMYVVPDQKDYFIYASSVDSVVFEHGYNELTAINISISKTAVNDTYGYINMTYLDTTGTTTGGTVEVWQKSATVNGADELVASWPATSSSFSNSTVISHASEISGVVKANVSTSTFGTVDRTYPYSFKGAPVQFLGFGENITLLVAFGIMLFTAMLGGATAARQVAFVVAIEGWIFFMLGWFNAMVTSGWGEGAIITALVLMTFVAIAMNMEMKKKRGP